jgi:protein-disulfide isomerase
LAGPLPIDIAQNIQIAYQFNGALAVFWHEVPFSDDWRPALQQVTEADGVRIFEQRFVTLTLPPIRHQHASYMNSPSQPAADSRSPRETAVSALQASAASILQSAQNRIPPASRLAR